MALESSSSRNSKTFGCWGCIDGSLALEVVGEEAANDIDSVLCGLRSWGNAPDPGLGRYRAEVVFLLPVETSWLIGEGSDAD